MPCRHLLGLFLLTAIQSAVQADNKEDDARIRQWVRQLDDERFETRQEASAKLREAGVKAVPALEASVGKSLEVTERAFKILNALAAAPDLNAAHAAQDALGRLGQSKDADIARRANEFARDRQWKIAGVFEQAGARVHTADDKIVSLYFGEARIAGLDFRTLRHLPDLQNLYLGNKDVDDAVLAQLGTLPKVEHLDLFQSRIGNDGLKHLKNLPRLKSVPMGMTRVTDAGLVHLKGLTQLEYIGLRGNAVTDAGLVHLKDLTNLTGLYLGETKVTDAGLVHLAGMTKMSYLRLHNVEVSDAGLKHLEGMKDLRRLDLWETRVTDQGMRLLREAVPEVQIISTSR
jgi:hypothetical protein